MLTKTRTIQKEENDLETNHSFSIPEKIKNNINEKGFSLYNWIGEQDVKQSIERDFLKLIAKLGTVFSLLLIIPSTILLYAKAYLFFYIYFFGLLGILNIFLIIYLIGIAIKRSNILRKNSQILITDSSVSINGKIKKLKDNKITSNKNLHNIGVLFEEELFKESNIHKTKKKFFEQVKDQISEGYSKIGRMSGRGRNSAQIMILLGALYSIYALSLGFIYLFGIFFIWIFGNILSIINKRLLLISGHEITTINNNFENIDKNSTQLVKEKNKLSKLLEDAMKNDWKDSLLLKINTGIKNINKNASNAVNTSIELKQRIKKSKYKEMFNFSIYNSWIKKQIHTPLTQILFLLEENLKKLEENKNNIENEIFKTIDESFSGPLQASKARTEMRINDIKKHIIGIKVYINKLK